MKSTNIYSARARQLDRMKGFYRQLKTCTDPRSRAMYTRWLEEAEMNYSYILDGNADLWQSAKKAIDAGFQWTESRDACLSECVKSVIDFRACKMLSVALRQLEHVTATTAYARDHYGIQNKEISDAVTKMNGFGPQEHNIEDFPGDPWPDDLTYGNH